MRSVFIFLTATCLLFACHKTSTTVNPGGPSGSGGMTPTGTMNINLQYAAGSSTESYELIISEPGGKVLLDTLSTLSTGIQTALKTNDTLVDVTSVRAGTTAGTFNVEVFRSINASTLAHLQLGDYVIRPRLGATVPRSIYYKHFPPTFLPGTQVFDSIFFTSFPYNEGSGMAYNTFDPSGPSLTVNYQLYGHNQAYLLLPQHGLYSLHTQVNQTDTIDLATMDTATDLTFDRPFPFTIYTTSSSFFGIPDTNDLTTLIGFTDVLQNSSKPGVDFEYANVPVQKYEMNIYGLIDSTDYFTYYFYGSQIPHALAFPTPSDFSIGSTNPANFSISFSGPSLTYYYTDWHGASVDLGIYAPPTSSSFKPIAWFGTLKSKMIGSTAFSDLSLKSFFLDAAAGMDYGTYLAYRCSAVVGQSRVITGDGSYTKVFP